MSTFTAKPKQTQRSINSSRGNLPMFEPLEMRQLLSGSLSILVNGKAPTDPIDFGTALQNAADPTKTITIKNTGTLEESGTLNLFNNQGGFDIKSTTNSTSSGADFSSFDLQPNDSTSITVEMQTANAESHSDSGADITVNTDNTLGTNLNFAGDVVAAAAAYYDNLGTVGNGTITQANRQITAEQRQDGEGNVVEQVSDQLYAFHVTAQTTLGLALSGFGADDNAAGAVVATLLPDQSNGGSKQLTIQERDAAIATLSAPINKTTVGTAKPTSSVIGPGYYFIYMSESSPAPAFDGDTGTPLPQTVTYTLNATVKQAPPAVVAVSGNGTAISSGDTTVSTSDGTSFGSVVAGTSESLTFTVNNTGGSALNISGSRPDVSGDFLVTSLLPGSIAAGGSATFTVAPSNTNAGAKSGLVSIKTDAGTFTFDVGGTYTIPNGPKPPSPTISKLTAAVTAKKLAKAASSYAFTVVYSDSTGLDLSSLSNRQVVLVTGPNGFRKWAKLISVTPGKGNRTVTAVYHIAPPVGAWAKSLNGSYHVYIRGSLLDKSGGTASILDKNGNPAPLTVEGVLTVHIAK